MQTYLNISLFFAAVTFLGGCSNTAGNSKKNNPPKVEENLPRENDAEKTKNPQEENDSVPEKGETPSQPGQTNPGTSVPSGCERECEGGWADVESACTYKGVTASGGDNCLARRNLQKHFCDQNLPFDWDAAKCTIHNGG